MGQRRLEVRKLSWLCDGNLMDDGDKGPIGGFVQLMVKDH